MSSIECTDIVKDYAVYEHPSHRLIEILTRGHRHKKFRALGPLSLHVGAGEVVGVIGRNGAGKSTLLKLLAGTLMPSTGTVQVHGRITALLEMGGGFHPEMTGRENVELSAAIKGISMRDLPAVYAEIVAFSGLEGFMDQPVKTYSSGMFVRLAFSVATCTQPDVLIVDEALSVGDGMFARKSFDRIMRFREQGATILFCSHSLYQIETLCDRAIWLEQGELKMDGNPADVVSAYNEFIDSASLAEKGSDTRSVETTASEVDRGPAYLKRVKAAVDERIGTQLTLRTNESLLSLEIEFSSDASFHAPSVAVVIHRRDGLVVSSTGTHNENLRPEREPDGSGRVSLNFPCLGLLKGHYTVDVFLLCEKGLHMYDVARSVALLKVEQGGLEQGVVSLPHGWKGTRPGVQADGKTLER